MRFTFRKSPSKRALRHRIDVLETRLNDLAHEKTRLKVEERLGKTEEILRTQGQALSRVVSLLGKMEDRLGEDEKLLSELNRIVNSRLDDGK